MEFLFIITTWNNRNNDVDIFVRGFEHTTCSNLRQSVIGKNEVFLFDFALDNSNNGIFLES